MKRKSSTMKFVLLVVAVLLLTLPGTTRAQIDVLTVDITPLVSPGGSSFGPVNTMGMALQQVDTGSDFNVTEVTPAAFSAMTAAQLSAYDLIAINNHPARIAPSLGINWHDAVGVQKGGRVVLCSHDAPRFKMIVTGGYTSPGPGSAPFGAPDLVRQAALWAGGVPGTTGLLIFNDSARFSTVGGLGWDNPELALPPAWDIEDENPKEAGFTFAPGGGYTDILPEFEAHPIYAGLSDARFGVKSISSFAANIVDTSFHSIFGDYNADIFTPTEVVINSGIDDPAPPGGSIGGGTACESDNGTPITLLRTATVVVGVDIKPGSCPNPFNAKSKGVVPVAIVATEDFDPTIVDLASITLTPEGGTPVSPINAEMLDSTQPGDYDPKDCDDCFNEEDHYNYDSDGDGKPDTYIGDGKKDLVLYFDTQALAAAIGEADRDDCVELTLKGVTDAGDDIEGSDSVVIKTKIK